MRNKKGSRELQSGKTITAVLIILVLFVVIVALFGSQYLIDFFKEILPDFNQDDVPSSLIEDAVVSGAEVEILLNDGEGRCIIHEVLDASSISIGLDPVVLEQYGVQGNELLKKDNEGKWEPDKMVASDDEVRLLEVRKVLSEKKNNLFLEYNGKEYPMKFSLFVAKGNTGLIAEINGVEYFYNGKSVYFDDLGYVRSSSDDTLKKAFSGFYNVEKNNVVFGSDSKRVYLASKYSYSFDSDDTLLFVYFEDEKTYYGIGYDESGYDDVFFKEDKDWEKKLEGRNVELQKKYAKRKIKDDLRRACYED